jgi:formiminoglutamase
MEPSLIIYNRDFIDSFINKRKDEKKLGEFVHVCGSSEVNDLKESLNASSAKYVLLGLPEDIGVRANFGRKGTDGCWRQSLISLLNIQSNYFLKGEELLILGRIDFSKWMKIADDLTPGNEEDLFTLRKMVSQIDDIVAPVIETIISSGKEVIVIGGGHNNSYGCIKGVSKALNKKINSVNCDPHADFRPLEGRHSGNGFSYAMNEGYLGKYSIVGLHQNYNSQTMLDDLRLNEKIDHSFFEDIFIHEKINFRSVIDKSIKFISGAPCGLELDIDAIENAATSAITPSGISANDARMYVTRVAESAALHYFHIAEGAPVLSGISNDTRTGKMVAYLVSDYMKARNKFYEKS